MRSNLEHTAFRPENKFDSECLKYGNIVSLDSAKTVFDRCVPSLRIATVAVAVFDSAYLIWILSVHLEVLLHVQTVISSE